MRNELQHRRKEVRRLSAKFDDVEAGAAENGKLERLLLNMR